MLQVLYNTKVVLQNLVGILKSKSPLYTIDKLPVGGRANADELYKLCSEYIKIYEEHTKWEKIKLENFKKEK